MARAAQGRSRDAAGLRRIVLHECGGLALIAFAAFGTLALWTYDASDPVLSSRATNAGGALGAALAAGLLRTFGLASVLAVAAVGVLGIRLVAGRGFPRISSRFWAATVCLVLALSALPPLVGQAMPQHAGLVEVGWLGDRLARLQSWVFGTWGAIVLNTAILAMGVAVASPASATSILSACGVALGRAIAGLSTLCMRAAQAAAAVPSGLRDAACWIATRSAESWRSAGVWREQRARRARVAAARDVREGDEPEAQVAPPGEAQAEPPRPRKLRRGEPEIVDHARERAPAARQEAFAFSESAGGGPFRLPDVSIFQEPPRGAHTYDRDSLIMNSRILEKKLGDFGVGGSVVTVHPGPVITMYEFEPASGIKVNKIVGLADDLALALRALSVRIIAPLPGKSVVGIEVANADREVVYLRDLLENDRFRNSKSQLPVALGKDIFGNPVDADLAKMPHLLVAGATGTGKSVFLNALLCSILCRKTPSELKLLLIDPKLLELSVYAGIPHLIADVVTNPKRASAALAGVVRKMEERYQLMAALGVRSIQQFNERCQKELAAGQTTFRLRPVPGEEQGLEVPFEPLAYIVVIIDELADLMVVCAKDVEESLQRLAQMARAAGIHLVLATQRPSVDVLTGIIKANFPARISFQVSSRTDSRTILDQNGSEHLLGSGDMLFLPPGTSKMQRLHGAFVTEDEVAKLARFLSEQGGPRFDEQLVTFEPDTEEASERGEDVDEMYDQAVRIVAETRNASISYIQRRLKVGYNRAARMIEQMEAEGVVGPQVGTKPRDVYVSAIDP
jgi:S-DNA-T family DNA segregation ATPase FtsK/SpoIIIE